MDLYHQEISRQVRLQLQHRRWTLERCCKAFNDQYSSDIRSGNVKPLNKDFLSRVARGSFKVCSERISKICEFLDIEEGDRSGEALSTLSREIEDFGRHSESNAELRARFPTIRKFLIGLNLQGLVDEPE